VLTPGYSRRVIRCFVGVSILCRSVTLNVNLLNYILMRLTENSQSKPKIKKDLPSVHQIPPDMFKINRWVVLYTLIWLRTVPFPWFWKGAHGGCDQPTEYLLLGTWSHPWYIQRSLSTQFSDFYFLQDLIWTNQLIYVHSNH
jgi:hypothetical protein